MRCIFFVLLTCISSEFIVVQADTTKTTDSLKEFSEDEIFLFAQRMPSFPGGEAKMNSFIMKKLKYPKAAAESGLQGVVVLAFVIEKDGSVTQIKTVRGLDAGLTQEAIRVFNLMPNWEPGMQNGRQVKVEMTYPFRFALE